MIVSDNVLQLSCLHRIAYGEKYQTIIADPIERRPIEILKDRKKETLKEYLRQHGDKVEVVVMDMSQSFKADVDQALGGPSF